MKEVDEITETIRSTKYVEAKLVKELLIEQKKRFIDFIDAHYLEHCRTQNGIPICKNCGLNISDLKELL